jgi:hypothetical protein
MRYTRISADCHIDMPWLPPDLFTSNCSAALKDRMPYVAEGPDGSYWATKNVPSLGLTCSVGSTGQKYVPGQNKRVDAPAAGGSGDRVVAEYADTTGCVPRRPAVSSF